jgi:shikimate kinase
MKNIILIGFMGTGKTSTGRLLASRLGYSFIDTDHKIEVDHQITIKAMFAKYGEVHFRKKESETIQKVAKYRNVVISTGGGVVLNPANLHVLQESGLVISLTAEIDVILDRTGRKSSRPLLALEDVTQRREMIVNLLDSRKDLYQKADFSIDTSNLSPLQVVEQILLFLRKEVGAHV